MQCKVVCMQGRVRLRTSTRLTGSLRPGGEFLDAFLEAMFLIFERKWSPKWSNSQGSMLLKVSQGRPKTLQNRICDATSIFHRFGIDFESKFNDIFMILNHFLLHFTHSCRQFLKVSAVALQLKSKLGATFSTKKATTSYAEASRSRPGRDLAPKTFQGRIFIDLGVVFNRSW